MKNKLTDLNNHLFAQLERLGDESLTDEQLTKGIDRAKSISQISKDVVSNATLVLDAEKFAHKQKNIGGVKLELPTMLGSK